MTIVKMPIALICTFLWIGFVCAISFMEAWLKFRAPGITVPLGLGIGRLVFNALNKVELVFAFVIIINIFWKTSDILKWQNLVFAIPLTLVLIQTFYLLPALDARAELHIQEQLVPPSNQHFYYVGMELLKVVGLTIFGITLFKNTTI
ncbi:MAG: hypothetical protein IPI60_05415 [Saprospiraceae bacterium]|nr:hypothetical protein [Saprospiraceae bacterium]